MAAAESVTIPWLTPKRPDRISTPILKPKAKDFSQTYIHNFLGTGMKLKTPSMRIGDVMPEHNIKESRIEPVNGLIVSCSPRKMFCLLKQKREIVFCAKQTGAEVNAFYILGFLNRIYYSAAIDITLQSLNTAIASM
ncbi:MAG: hypothetical protein HZA15_07510 [Nitrospirae bacterium]|nr:hypothetical protein [Nitrospirota bacterium]